MEVVGIRIGRKNLSNRGWRFESDAIICPIVFDGKEKYVQSMGIVSTPVWNSPKQLGINVPEFYEITLVEKNGVDKNLVRLSQSEDLRRCSFERLSIC